MRDTLLSGKVSNVDLKKKFIYDDNKPSSEQRQGWLEKRLIFNDNSGLSSIMYIDSFSCLVQKPWPPPSMASYVCLKTFVQSFN